MRLRLTIAVLAALLGLPTGAAAVTTAQLNAVGAGPCPNVESSFRCFSLTVPLDHFDPTNPATTTIVIAIHRATAHRSKGLLVTAVGGPGASGLTDADALLTTWSPAVIAAYDVVYFDQRGIGESGGLYCPRAVLASRRAEGAAVFDVVGSSRTFARRCSAELDSTALLPFLGTRQAAEDLEAARLALGAPPLRLYGTSYGTELAAAYARQHPEGLTGLILDGVVDTSLSAPAFWASAARGFESVLNETLASCSRRAACRQDLPHGARRAYDQLNARLARHPVRVTGGTGLLTQALLHTYVGSALYTPSGRLGLLEDLAAAAHGDLSRLVEGAWIAEGVDPTTWRLLNTSVSYASYFGIQCADSPAYVGTSNQRVAEWTTAASVIDRQLPRIGEIVFLNNLPCAWWPSPPALTSPPAPLVAAGIPTIVLTATGDPITPHEQGDAVVRSLADGYLIRTLGGPHVTLSPDAPCPDRIVERFLLRDQLPARRTTCPGRFVAPYWR